MIRLFKHYKVNIAVTFLIVLCVIMLYIAPEGTLITLAICGFGVSYWILLGHWLDGKVK